MDMLITLCFCMSKLDISLSSLFNSFTVAVLVVWLDFGHLVWGSGKNMFFCSHSFVATSTAGNLLSSNLKSGVSATNTQYPYVSSNMSSGYCASKCWNAVSIEDCWLGSCLASPAMKVGSYMWCEHDMTSIVEMLIWYVQNTWKHLLFEENINANILFCVWAINLLDGELPQNLLHQNDKTTFNNAS